MATLDSDVTMVPAGETSSSAAPSSSSKKPKRFEIKKWSAVALWAWGRYHETLILPYGDRVLLIGSCCLIADIVVDNCAICRNHIMDLCKLEIKVFLYIISCFE